MAMKNITVFPKLSSIPCHAFNKDMTKIAASNLDAEAYIYTKVAGKWELECELLEHSSRITGIDWDPVYNRIVTSGSDRNAHVWVEDPKKPGKWIPTMVILRSDRAATCVKWSPCGLKFAVGTGSKEVSICYYDQKSNWWACKKIKKGIKSTVLSVDWHPDSSVLAVGSTDFRTRIYCAKLDDVDVDDKSNCWSDGKKCSFGSLIGEYNNCLGGWIHSVSFSPDGKKLAVSSHDCCLSVADASISSDHFVVKRLKLLPLVDICWVDNSTIAGAGHNFKPYLFSYSSGSIELKKCLDDQEGGDKKDQAAASAFSKFQNMDRFAQEKMDNNVKSAHLNCIRQIRKLPSGKLATSGLDNQLIEWVV